MKVTVFLLAAAWIGVTPVEPLKAATAAPCGKVERTATGVRLVRGGKTVWNFEIDADDGKPYVHPLVTPSGETLTDVRPSDHPWHKGLWFAWKFLNGANGWEKSVSSVVSKEVAVHGLGARVRLALTHRDAEGAALAEKRTVDFLPPDEIGGYAILSEHEFTALKDVTLDRTPPYARPDGAMAGGYAGLTLRLTADAAKRFAVRRDGQGFVTFANPSTGESVLLYAYEQPETAKFYAWPDRRMLNLSPVWSGPVSLKAGEKLRLRYAVRLAAPALKTPETSSLFERHEDPETRVVSYFLKPGLADYNQQSIYFTAKSMTDDGRFLVFWTAPSELGTPRPSEGTRRMRLVDFQTDTVLEIDGANGDIPYLDVKADALWWIDRNGLHRRDLLVDPQKDAFTLPLPPELRDHPVRGRFRRFCTHLTPTADRKRFFLDAANDNIDFQGMLNLETGMWEEWDTARFLCNHGQVSPADETLALCAQECATSYTLDELAEMGLPTDGVEFRNPPFVTTVARPDGLVYPRLWLCRKGRKRMVHPLVHNYATHENFTEDGRGVYYCGGAVTLMDLRSGRQGVVSPLLSAHATMSADLRYVTSDISVGGWWRGCSWRVNFFNRDTHRAVMIHARRPEYMPRDDQSRLHPDPHPQFVCNDRYIVCTVAGEDRRMNVSVTPVEQLVAMTSDPKTAPTPRRIPLDWDPKRPVDRPYEVSFDVVRMARAGLVAAPAIPSYASWNAYAVEAKVRGTWQEVKVRPLAHRDETRLTLRFRVPEGTTELRMVGDVSRRFSPRDTTGEENLFAGMLTDSKADCWSPSKSGGTPLPRFCKEGVMIVGAGTVRGEVPVPEDAAGKPVKLELDIFGGGTEESSAAVRLVQLDASGVPLAVSVVEGLASAYPAGKAVFHRVNGVIDRRAKRLVLEIAPSGDSSRLIVQRLNLRVGEDLPFDPFKVKGEAAR